MKRPIVIIFLSIGITSSALLALLVVLLLVFSRIDEIDVDSNWLSKNISFPCSHAEVLEATYDADYNTVNIQANIPERAAFENALATAGWAQLRSYDNMVEFKYTGDTPRQTFLYVSYTGQRAAILATYHRRAEM